MTNLLGFGIEGLDVPGLATIARLVFAALALFGAVLSARRVDDRRAGRIVLWVGIAGHALAWFATMFPLANVYGANGSMDRENHLGWANVVALGFSPLRTFQVNHLHFEPLWPLLTAMASGFNAVDQNLQSADWSSLKTTAHTLKSQFSYMGVSEAKEIALSIENNAAQNTNLEQIPAQVERIKIIFLTACEELKAAVQAF